MGPEQAGTASLSTPVMRRTIMRTMMIIGPWRTRHVDDFHWWRRRHRDYTDFLRWSVVFRFDHDATAEPERHETCDGNQRDLLHNSFSMTSDILRMSCP
jgi:hypothetical protein